MADALLRQGRGRLEEAEDIVGLRLPADGEGQFRDRYSGLAGEPVGCALRFERRPEDGAGPGAPGPVEGARQITGRRRDAGERFRRGGTVRPRPPDRAYPSLVMHDDRRGAFRQHRKPALLGIRTGAEQEVRAAYPRDGAGARTDMVRIPASVRRRVGGDAVTADLPGKGGPLGLAGGYPDLRRGAGRKLCRGEDGLRRPGRLPSPS